VLLKFKIYLDTKVTEWNIDYPQQNQISFPIDPNGNTVTINKIMLNGIEANKFYNTSFHIDGSDVVLTSVHEISLKGIFTLQIDDLYILSHRSGNWHCSTKKQDHIFQYEFTNDSFTSEYRDRDHKGFHKDFIPCFGCSVTYGYHQPATDSWPYLLAESSRRNYINLGVCGAGIDTIYTNLKLLHQKHNFTECIILFPGFDRRVVRCKVENYYVSIPNTVELSNATSDFQFLKDEKLAERMHKVNQNIVKDIENRYSKIFLQKIIAYCKSNAIRVCVSSWDQDVYDHLTSQKDVVLLDKFPSFKMFPERANDGIHPHKRHYQYFSSIIQSQKD
tara:strand:+ start:281 stop:1279 length:999 start_codon:yes stop_codon:yes gene_type:complete